MSYLNVPRIQFGGLFFTNPATINNIIGNYNPKVPLQNSQGQYLPNAVWNPLGISQVWLSQCSVLSVVDASGTYSSTPGSDPVIGAPVETPSPSTKKQMPNSTKNYDNAKMVDLDPEQQGRSALFGLRIYVTLPNGAGCSGLVTVPELQYLLNRVPNPQSSWGAVGTWMGQITDVTWTGDLSSSPFLTQFQAACGQGIAVKLTVDLHQNNPSTTSTQGNMFCYGRVLGSLGPIGTGELPQVVPGRQISPPPPPAPAGVAMAAMAPAPQATLRHPSGKRMINERFGGGGQAPSGALAAAAPAPAAPAQPWNPAPAQVSQVAAGSMLHVDLGGSIYVQGGYTNGVGASNGQFLVDSGIDIGYLDGQGNFQPLTNGQGLSFANQYQQLSSQNKQVFLVQSSGLVDIPLEPDEVSAIAGSPLAVQAGGAVVLQEAASGYLLGTDPFSVRMVPGGTASFQLMARQFGQPIVGQQPMTWTIVDDSGNQSTEISIAWNGSTDANGLATLEVSTPGGDVNLPKDRAYLDTNIYFGSFSDPDGQPIGDAYADPQPNANLSALRFQDYTAPASPTWQNDVGPVLQAYARLYPGMTQILNIGDETTVEQNAAAIAQRLSLLFLDPALMPVTRDLSPAKVAMIVQWLNAQTGS
ncbi:MAG TPA: hypothetical protein VNW71_12940 [Thermoanaerobaculia bacterium]|nr:hypothetical protein [Thermoanaerobaculia bacterium]